MLKVISIFILGLFLLLTGSVNEIKASPFAVSFQVFYDELSPYGDWVEDPHYGFIWIPYAEQGFQPYRTNGHWVMSSYGNTWVSTYDWGWAPFHYGRWFFNDMYGWAWIPGYEWGPAWVNWRSGRGYYGWFPLGPRVQFYASVRFPVYSHWVFVPRRRLLSRNIYRYYLPGRNVNVIYNQTNIINNTYVYNNQTYITGPSRSELQRVTRRDVPVYQVREGQRPGRSSINNNRLDLYKPEIRRAGNQARGETNARPRNYTSSRDYKPANTNQVRTERRATVPGTNTRSTIRSEALNDRGESSSRSTGRNEINSRNNNVRPGSAVAQPNNARQRNYNREAQTNVRQRQTATSNPMRQVQPKVRTPQQQTEVRVAPRERTVRPNTQNVTPRQRNTMQNNSRINPGNSRQEVRRSAPSPSVNRSTTQRQRSQQVQSPSRRSNPTVNRSRTNTKVAPAQSSQRARSSTAPSNTSRSRRGN